MSSVVGNWVDNELHVYIFTVEAGELEVSCVHEWKLKWILISLCKAYYYFRGIWNHVGCQMIGLLWVRFAYTTLCVNRKG